MEKVYIGLSMKENEKRIVIGTIASDYKQAKTSLEERLPGWSHLVILVSDKDAIASERKAMIDWLRINGVGDSEIKPLMVQIASGIIETMRPSSEVKQ